MINEPLKVEKLYSDGFSRISDVFEYIPSENCLQTLNTSLFRRRLFTVQVNKYSALYAHIGNEVNLIGSVNHNDLYKIPSIRYRIMNILIFYFFFKHRSEKRILMIWFAWNIKYMSKVWTEDVYLFAIFFFSWSCNLNWFCCKMYDT